MNCIVCLWDGSAMENFPYVQKDDTEEAVEVAVAAEVARLFVD